MAEKRQFIPSVADVYGYDPSTGELLFAGESNVSSMIEMAMSEQEVRGGKNHQLLFNYNFGRTLNFEIESASFNYAFFATNVGKAIVSQGADLLKKECITLAETTGTGTLSETPLDDSKVVAFNVATGEIEEFEETGDAVTLIDWEGQDVEFLYFYNKDEGVDVLDIDASTVPSVVNLVMRADRFDSAGINGYVQIDIPRAQISGNFTLSFASDNVLSTQLSGKALVESAGCSGGLYGQVKVVDVVVEPETP